MARTTGPLASLSAAGTLVPGITFRRRGGLTICERTPYHAIKPTQASIANQTIIKCLTAWWHTVTAPERFGWDALAPGYAPTAYHAFLKYTLRRIWAGLYPSRWYPTPTVLPGGNISGVSHSISSNHVRLGYNSLPANPRTFDIAWRTQVTPTVRSPATLAGIWLVPVAIPYGYRLHDDVHVPAGVWHYFFTSVSRDYGPYPGLAWRTLTIPG